MYCFIARQRGKFASERSKIRRLTSPNAEFCEISIVRGTLYSIRISHIDFLGCRAVTITCTDPILCTTNSVSPNEYKYPEIWMKNRPNRILGELLLGGGEGCEALSSRYYGVYP